MVVRITKVVVTMNQMKTKYQLSKDSTCSNTQSNLKDSLVRAKSWTVCPKLFGAATVLMAME